MLKSPEKTITILGAGALGTALAVLIADFKKARVKLWDRNPKLIQEIRRKRRNPDYFTKDIKISPRVELFTDLKKAVENSDLILLAVPSFAIREVCRKLGNTRLPPLLTTSKGMEEKTGYFPSEIIEDTLIKTQKQNNVLHLNWVGFAKEIYHSIPATVVLASKNQILLKEFGGIFNFRAKDYRLSVSRDLKGAQLAGALKNVLAIGVGIAQGQTEDLKIKQGLIRKGVKEMIAFGRAIGAKEKILKEAGAEDLKISSTPRSRNYSYGKAIFEKGVLATRRELAQKGVTVEGFHTASVVQRTIEKYKLNLPLLKETCQTICGKKNPRLAAKNLIKLAL